MGLFQANDPKFQNLLFHMTKLKRKLTLQSKTMNRILATTTRTTTMTTITTTVITMRMAAITTIGMKTKMKTTPVRLAYDVVGILQPLRDLNQGNSFRNTGI